MLYKCKSASNKNVTEDGAASVPLDYLPCRKDDDVVQCFPTFLMPRTPCSECYFTAAPIKSKMEISCIFRTYDKNEVINHNFTTLNVSSMTMQYCINGDFRMNMNISIRPNIMNLTQYLM
jgi:hypothetical protein